MKKTAVTKGANTPRVVARAIAERILGKEFTFRLLSKGAASLVYLAEKGTKHFVIKIRPDHCEDYTKEAAVLKRLAGERIAPKLIEYGTIAKHHYCVQEYFEGKELPWKNITTADTIAAARFFKKLHTDTRAGATSDHTAIRGMIVYAQSVLDKAKSAATKKEAQRLQAIIDTLAAKPLPTFSCPLAFRHGDPNPHNLLRGKSGIRAIDWEGAKEGPVITDIVDFIMKANLPAAKRDLFLRTYGWKDQEAVEQWMRYRLLGMTVWHLEQCWLITTGKHAHETYINEKRRYWLFTRRLATLEKTLAK